MEIHFWQLPEDRNYVILKEALKEKIVRTLETKRYPWKFRDRFKNRKISLKKLKHISKNENFSLKNIEKNIIWIGGNNSKGLSYPKIPFRMGTRSSARFIAAIINDGTLTRKKYGGYGRLMYDNYDIFLRNSVIKDYLNTFGGKDDEVAYRENKNKKYLEFSSVMRDIVKLIIKSSGSKAESNLDVPNFVFESKKTKIGWIEQTIADEGEVKYYPKKYRRSIVWRRSLDVTGALKNERNLKETSIRKLPLRLQQIVENQKCKLIENEKKMLESLGIDYSIYNLGIYLTCTNKIRTRWQISITKRKNLLHLRKLIKIPSKVKEIKFTKLTKEFVRSKEPLKIKNALLTVGRNGKIFTSVDLKSKMNYKNTACAMKWIHIFEKQGLVEKVRDSIYGGRSYRQPAQYKLILNK